MKRLLIWFPFFSILFLQQSIIAQTFNVCNEMLNKNEPIEIDISQNNKTLIFNYRPCNLDLSDFAYLTVDIENYTNAEIIIDVACIGPKSHLKNEGRFFIKTKEQKTNRVILTREKLNDNSEWKPYFEEIRALPGNYVKHWNAFDLTKVKTIRVTISSKNKEAEGKVLVKPPYGLQNFDFPNLSFKEFTPILDEMGQSNFDNWDNKVSDTEILKQYGAFDYGRYMNKTFSSQFSKYGGNLNGKKMKATGHFYTIKIDGRWWFVDPEGYLFWSQGITGVGNGVFTSTKGKKELFPALHKEVSSSNSNVYSSVIKENLVDFYSLNLIRKYGNKWKQRHEIVTSGRLKNWGINTYGAWSKTPKNVKHPYTLIIHPRKQGIGKIEKMIDPFSSDFKMDLKARVARLSDRKNDPWLLGVFVNNELHWNNEMTIPLEVLKTKESTAARKAFEKFFTKKYASIEDLNLAWGSNFESFKKMNATDHTTFNPEFETDMIAYLDYFAGTYYKTVAEELKKILPNHLYLGSRLHGKVKNNKTIHKVNSRYCDVISFNIYQYSVKDFKVFTEVDKPMLIGEFHFGTGSHGVWGMGLRSAESLQNQADLYKNYMQEALEHPSIIGAHWFQWVDQPATGRNSDGENFRIGIVSVTDQPYEEFVKAIFETSKTLYSTRLKTN